MCLCVCVYVCASVCVCVRVGVCVNNLSMHVYAHAQACLQVRRCVKSAVTHHAGNDQRSTTGAEAGTGGLTQTRQNSAQHHVLSLIHI